MIDFKAPSSVKAIEALHKGRTRELLLKFAGWFTHTAAAAEDLLAEALLLVCDPVDGRPWDEARGSFVAHMRIVVRDLARAQRRSAQARREEASPAKVDRAQSASPRPDDALSDARELERLRRLGARVRERIAHNERTLAVFDSRYEGIDRAADIAAQLGCTVDEVHDSNRQIAYHAGKVLAEERVAEEARMKELRERAKKERKP